MYSKFHLDPSLCSPTYELVWDEGKEIIYRFFLGIASFIVLLTDAIISSEQWVKQLNADISELDPEISDIIEHEKNRQWKVWGDPSKCLRWTYTISFDVEFAHSESVP